MDGKLMQTFKLKEDNIKLGQVLKAMGMVENGADAKEVIQQGMVRVNGEIETRRGKKLTNGDQILFEGQTVKIVK